jgi:hypothetical protein
VRGNKAMSEQSHSALLPTLTFSTGTGIRHRDKVEKSSREFTKINADSAFGNSTMRGLREL